MQREPRGIAGGPGGIVTAGVELLHEALVAQGVEAEPVEWRPPVDGLQEPLARIAAVPRTEEEDDFDVDLDADRVTCPGQRTVRLRRCDDGSGWASFGDRCAACPLQAQCTTSPQGRTVQIGPHERLLQAQRARQQDPAWQADYQANRPKVERGLAHMVRRSHGGRKARVRGTQRVDQDWNWNTAARNVARLATLRVRHTAAGWQAATA